MKILEILLMPLPKIKSIRYWYVTQSHWQQALFNTYNAYNNNVHFTKKQMSDYISKQILLQIFLGSIIKPLDLTKNKALLKHLSFRIPKIIRFSLFPYI